MMGVHHSMSGLAAGAAVAPLLGAETLPEALPVAILAAGAATIPDIDTHSSAISRRWGDISQWVSRHLAAASSALYSRTKGPRDESWEGSHRHLTHTMLFALVAGGAATGLALLWIGFAAPIYAIVAAMAADRLGPWAGWLGAAGIAAGIPVALTDPTRAALLLGAAVTVGCLAHDIGDALTVTGCPILFPIMIAGETWYEIRILGPFSFRTNGRVEKLLVAPVLAVLIVVAFWPIMAATAAAGGAAA